MTFTRMDASTAADWDHIAHASVDSWALVPDRILDLLRSLAEVTCGFAVDQLEHGLQTATRAERAGADDEVVDPDYDTLPLDHFEPLVRHVFAAPKRI